MGENKRSKPISEIINFGNTTLPANRKKIAALNKARSKTQERRIAAYFKGSRVPMSGSGSIKGDCVIPLDEYRSIYVECKLTEKDKIQLQTEWLEKINKDTKSMRCVYGILVISFMRHKEDYVCLPMDMAQKLGILTLPTKDGIIEKSFTVHRLLPAYSIHTNHGIWSFCEKADLKKALESHA